MIDTVAEKSTFLMHFADTNFFTLREKNELYKIFEAKDIWKKSERSK